MLSIENKLKTFQFQDESNQRVPVWDRGGGHARHDGVCPLHPPHVHPQHQGQGGEGEAVLKLILTPQYRKYSSINRNVSVRGVLRGLFVNV